MSPEENKALFFRDLDALRAKNPDELKAVLAPDFVGHDLPPGLPPGPEGLILFRTKVNEAFPDQQMVVEDLLAVDDRVIARLTLTQTHQGEYMGIVATGKPVTLELIEIDRIANGQIAERWAQVNFLHLLRQPGATHLPPG
jgi:predicted ester cyclase